MDLEAELENLGSGVQSVDWLPVALMIPALAVIVIGSTVMVQGAVTLEQRWDVAGVLVGAVALATATSLPNAYAAIRLALDGHGAAVVSATFNSNTLNLIAGIAMPIVLFPALRRSVPPGYIVWLLGMSVLALILLATGLTRRVAARRCFSPATLDSLPTPYCCANRPGTSRIAAARRSTPRYRHQLSEAHQPDHQRRPA